MKKCACYFLWKDNHLQILCNSATKKNAGAVNKYFFHRAVRLTVTIVNVILRRFLLNLQQTRIKIRMENNLAHQAMA